MVVDGGTEVKAGRTSGNGVWDADWIAGREFSLRGREDGGTD